MTNIRQQIQKATKWSIFTEIIVKCISPITNMILARLLIPEEFGIVATVALIISFTDIFTDAGFQKYIIQHQFKNDDDEDLSISVAFWTNISVSVVLWFLIFIFADKLAITVGNNGLGHVIFIGALVLPLTSFSSIQTAVYRKNLNYKALAYARIALKTIPFVVTIPLAIYGFSYWSLIIGDIIGELCNAVLLTSLCGWRPKLKYSFRKLKEMFSFCFWTLLETVSAWLVSNIGIFVIGRVFNTYYLGIYKTGIILVTQITSLISAPTINVLFSALSKLQDRNSDCQKLYFDFLRVIALLVIPLGVGIFLYRDVVTEVLLGNQWADANLLIGLWGFVLTESIIFNDMSGALILSKGKPQLLFISNIIQAICMFCALCYSAEFGFVTTVIISCLIRVQLPVMQTIIACVFCNIKLVNLLLQIKNYLFATIIMLLAHIAVRKTFTQNFVQYISIFICIIVYFLTLYVIPTCREEIKKYVSYAKCSINNL